MSPSQKFRAIALVAMWAAIAVIGYRDPTAGTFCALYAMIVTVMVFIV